MSHQTAERPPEGWRNPENCGGRCTRCSHQHEGEHVSGRADGMFTALNVNILLPRWKHCSDGRFSHKVSDLDDGAPGRRDDFCGRL